MMHHDFQRAEAQARIERYRAEAGRQVTRTRRLPRWFRAGKQEQKIGSLRPRGVG